MKKHAPHTQYTHTLPRIAGPEKLGDHRRDTLGETSRMAPGTAATALDHGLPRASWMLALYSLGLALALWSATCLGEEAAPSGAGGQRLVIEATQEIKELDVEAIRQGRFQPRTMLSADIAKAPLRTALKLLTRKTGIKVFVAAAVPDEGLSVKFDTLPLEEALKRLLKGKNYLLTYGETVASLLEHQGSQAGKSETAKNEISAKEGEQNKYPNERQITELRILSPSGGQTNENLVEIKEKPSERAREIEALVEKARKGATPKDRVAALEEFQGLADDEEIPAILSALDDEDEGVRRTALETLQNQSSGTPPVEEIAELAYSDLSPKLRMEALAAVVEFRPGQAEAYIQRALKDPDAKVRDHAEHLLDLNAKLAELQNPVED